MNDEQLRTILSQLHQAGRMMGDKPRGEEIQTDLDDAERRIYSSTREGTKSGIKVKNG